MVGSDESHSPTPSGATERPPTKCPPYDQGPPKMLALSKSPLSPHENWGTDTSSLTMLQAYIKYQDYGEMFGKLKKPR